MQPSLVCLSDPSCRICTARSVLGPLQAPLSISLRRRTVSALTHACRVCFVDIAGGRVVRPAGPSSTQHVDGHRRLSAEDQSGRRRLSCHHRRQPSPPLDPAPAPRWLGEFPQRDPEAVVEETVDERIDGAVGVGEQVYAGGQRAT